MPSNYLDHDWFSRPLPDNIRIGKGSWLYSSYAFVHYGSAAPAGLRAGSDTGLYHGTFFDIGPNAEVEIGDYCSLVGVIFSTNGRVSIGDYTFIAHEVVIADTHWAAPARHHSQRKDEVGPHATNNVEIGPNVWIGGQAVIVGSVRIGEGAIIGAGSLVTHDVPPYALCVGNPMRIVLSRADRNNSATQ
jgi:acetyltransferase-like isoleucine patch superfamily enzyme